MTRIKNTLTHDADIEAMNEACVIVGETRHRLIPFGAHLAMLLDAVMPLVDAEAKREASREKGKALKCITAQGRAKACREALAKAEKLFGFEP
jgi:hypothetical protein